MADTMLVTRTCWWHGWRHNYIYVLQILSDVWVINNSRCQQWSKMLLTIFFSLSAKDFDDRERCLKLQSYHKFIDSHADCVKKSKYAELFASFYLCKLFLDKPRSASNCKHSFVENMNIINQLIPKFLKNNSFGFEVSLMVSQACFIFLAGPVWSLEIYGALGPIASVFVLVRFWCDF